MALASNREPTTPYLPRFDDEKRWIRPTVVIYVSPNDLGRAGDD